MLFVILIELELDYLLWFSGYMIYNDQNMD